MFEHPAYSGVTRLVIGYGAFLFLGYYLVFTFETSYYPVDSVEEILFLYGIFVMTGRYQGRLVADIGDVGSGKTGRLRPRIPA